MSPSGDRVLIVESDPDISDFIARQALKPLGYDVKVVDQAADAIEEAIKNPPDLIIANLNLPDLGGKDVLAALSAQGVTGPLVVIAQKGDERRAIQAFRLGAADALLWPAQDAEIVRIVERALQPTRSRRIRRQLYQQLENIDEELKRRTHELQVMLDLSRALSSRAEPGQFFGHLLEHALEFAGADIAWFTVRDDATRSYILRAQRNLPAGWAKKINQPLDDGLSSLVVLSGRSLSIHGQPLEKFKVASLGKSAAVLPVKAGNEVLAVLIVIRKADAEIETRVKALLEALADFASISLLNARLFRALEAAAPRRDQKDGKALLASLHASLDRLARLPVANSGELTQEQKAEVTAIQTTLDRLIRSTGGGDPRG